MAEKPDARLDAVFEYEITKMKLKIKNPKYVYIPISNRYIDNIEETLRIYLENINVLKGQKLIRVKFIKRNGLKVYRLGIS